MVGSSLTRDLQYNLVCHSLSPILWSSDGDRVDRINTRYIKSLFGNYYRCRGQCACAILEFCPDVNALACPKHTVCMHTFENCSCSINGSKVATSASLYVFTHSAYYISPETIHSRMPAGASAIIIAHKLPIGTLSINTRN
jgi:hypothetical protein